MKLIFHLHYSTSLGQQLYLSGNCEELGSWDVKRAKPMNHLGNGIWEIDLLWQTGSPETLEYKYFIVEEGQSLRWEWGANHSIGRTDSEDLLTYLEDRWQNPPASEKVFYTSTFQQVLMKSSRKQQSIPAPDTDQKLTIQLCLPRIHPDYQLCLLGNQEILGNWDQATVFQLQREANSLLWQAELDVHTLHFPLYYKFGIWNCKTNELATLEEGFDREISRLPEMPAPYHFRKTEGGFRYPLGNWKAAGVAVPVFSLRTENSFGVGDFNDLCQFTDWAHSVGMKMIQLLPVNETVASHNWLDSYPYKSISVKALHPIYLNLGKMGELKNPQVLKEFEADRQQLNELDHVDYPQVHRLKSRYYKLLYDQDGEELFQSNAFKKFFHANKEWLVPYAAFVYLRDQFKDPNFRNWGEFRRYDRVKIEELSAPGAATRDDILVHYFIQFHLDKQLKEAAKQAHKKGIILKGDIPIGISPNSVEAWTEPHLFNLDAQAGAPPDDFAVKGQNWGFPTYNWEEMAKSNYSWWTSRLEKMAEYFDTYRIDHILGFFRIWEIPEDAVEALLGHFSPALPLTAEEIESYGIPFQFERFTKPYIRRHLLLELFGDKRDEVIQKFLEATDERVYRFKEEFNNQQKINAHFLKGIEEEELSDENRHLRDGLFSLLANVLFVCTGHNQWHPRISMQLTSSYAELDLQTRDRLHQLYNDYYYKRHEDFWYQKGMEKLPTITAAGNMLVCGEDLGMIPACVPRAMEQLGILSLEIQRMPKDPRRQFAHPADAPYLSVCTSSTHDMSTIRGWWEEDRERTQLFYNQELGNWGEAPYYAEPEVCRQIIAQHLHSPAMWTTFPIQDLLAMDGQLRWDETHNEQINWPANVRHRWRFRMNQSIDDLKAADNWNELLRNLLKESGRSSDY